ncbi:S53 family peptidase [Solirubrobacter ginsenosidimutans]|uniref:S53 family peptidase n=1 Tax=Solirubrobacter ginsenosidimutans TaxID=490573 RepID=A0A9X3MN74_9ACTN|nr:S53 family peptidase [Solirubrobacter ginsenosidimutans]MDA0159282.1 S53 family peptidase [Solirubrobacter ginsenosidimutans]
MRGGWCREVVSRSRIWTSAATALALLAGAPAAFAASVDYGPISHSGLKNLGAASTSLKLPLQLGLIVSQSNLQNAVKAASDPSSSSYGKYPSLSTLQSKYGASSSKRNAVVNAFKSNGITATVDVTHLRVSATVSVSKAQKMFGTKWNVYKTSTGSKVALPVDTPKLPSGISGNVDTVAGMRVQLSSGSSSSVGRAAVVADGGTPTRTGTPAFGCVPTSFPAALASSSGLYPNQILTAYGIAPLQAAGLNGQGVGLAIVGEAPTPAADVNTFRSCFGTQGTALKIHNAGSIQPILESSLDAMVASMVAPALARFDLWVQPIDESDDDGDVEGFLLMLAQPLQATTNGTSLPAVISVSYGECESIVQPFTAARTLVERQLTATAALGITTVVAAGDTGSSACARGVPASQLTSSDKKPQVSWPASSPWVLAVGGTNLTLNADNTIASSGAWNDTAYPAPFEKTAGGGGGSSAFESRPWWQPAQPFASSSKRMVPDVSAFADASPGYPIVCSSGVKNCTGSGQSIAFVGGTSAATPLVAGMIALWNQQARSQGLPRPGFVPPLLTSLAQHNPQTVLDITQGTNALFGGSCCPTRTGFDLATGWGSPIANVIASALAR